MLYSAKTCTFMVRVMVGSYSFMNWLPNAPLTKSIGQGTLEISLPMKKLYANQCSSKLQMKNPIWPPLRGHNSKRLSWPAGSHPEINDLSYILPKKYTKTFPLRVKRDSYGGWAFRLYGAFYKFTRFRGK